MTCTETQQKGERQHSPNGGSSIDSSALCVECNMCCSGRIFGRAKVTESEKIALGDGGDFNFDKSDGHWYLKLPCRSLCASGGCSRYADRPAACRDYECHVLQKASRGEVDYLTAREIVTTAKKLHQKVAKAARDAIPEPFRLDLDLTDARMAMTNLRSVVHFGLVSPDAPAVQAVIDDWEAWISYGRDHFNHVTFGYLTEVFPREQCAAGFPD